MASNRPVSSSKSAHSIDVMVSGGITLFVFTALTQAAKDWITEFVSRDGYQPAFPNTIYCEHRFAGELAEHMSNSGLVVR